MQFMNGMAERVSNGIDRTAESLQRLNTGASAPIFSAAASLHLPGAQLSLKVAEAVETGADRVHTWASGANVEVAEPAPARARRAKRA